MKTGTRRYIPLNSQVQKNDKRKKDTRERIIKEATDLFYEYGFARSSTRQLVGRLGMTSSAIYNHFKDKDEILYTIIRMAGDKVLSTLEEVIQNFEDPAECLREMIIRMILLFAADKKEIRVFAEELYQLPKNLKELCNAQHSQIYRLFRNRIAEILEKENVKNIDPTIATFGVVGAMLWTYNWFRETGKFSIEQVADQLGEFVFCGLRGSSYPTDVHKNMQIGKSD